MKVDATAGQTFMQALGLEWLEANGRGGFSFGTVAGANTTRYQALLLAARNPASKSIWASCLYPNRFDQPHVFSGEGKLFSQEIVSHMLRVRSAGQREHPDLHRKPKDDLCKTRP
jgi:hypothetical protein